MLNITQHSGKTLEEWASFAHSFCLGKNNVECR
jgi:hypothetical protein